MRIAPSAVASPTASTSRETPEPALGPPAGLTQRLATIKLQIETGEYPIDLDKLAARIVDDDGMRGSNA